MLQNCQKCGIKLIPDGKFCPNFAENVEHLTMKLIFETSQSNIDKQKPYSDPSSSFNI
jgi:hypothetical protein